MAYASRALFLLLAALSAAFSSGSSLAAELGMGATPPEFKLEGEKGGKVDGSAWDYKEFVGKVQLIFYVDPDEKKAGEELEDALKAEDFSRDQIHSTAIVNMDATGLPNFMIEMTLSSKQKKFPTTTYAKDFKKHLVKEWGLTDDAYNFIILNKKGELIYKKTGKPKPEEIKSIIELIKKNFVVAG